MSQVIKYYYTKPIDIITKKIIQSKNVTKEVITNHKFGIRQTYAYVWDIKTNTIRIGIATCNTDDKFTKNIGKHISFNRASTKPLLIEGFKGNFKDFLKFVIEKSRELEEGALSTRYHL